MIVSPAIVKFCQLMGPYIDNLHVKSARSLCKAGNLDALIQAHTQVLKGKIRKAEIGRV